MPMAFIFLMGYIFTGNVQVSIRPLHWMFGGNGCACDLRRTFEQFVNVLLTVFGYGNMFGFIYLVLCFFVSVFLYKYFHPLKWVDFGQVNYFNILL